MSQALTSTVFYHCALMFLCPTKVGPNIASVVPPRWPGTPLQVPWGCAPHLVLQRHFLVVGAGPALTPPSDRALRCAFSAHGHFIRCTARVLSQAGARLPFNVLLRQAPEPPAGPRHHASLRPRRRPRTPRYRLQRGHLRSGIGLPLVPLGPRHPRILTL
ncbi:hypothetical protein NDU88_005178 [Pleurodeles waltl]|uniref:Uncharacterized protein n=1 Tax=Pleurodeles waltl TaxID=8319 RepID=A0AAV7X0E9_PLEWA|nr:hypothetical protein NDU88_005178 [Pleurodeles waltl]